MRLLLPSFPGFLALDEGQQALFFLRKDLQVEDAILDLAPQLIRFSDTGEEALAAFPGVLRWDFVWLAGFTPDLLYPSFLKRVCQSLKDGGRLMAHVEVEHYDFSFWHLGILHNCMMTPVQIWRPELGSDGLWEILSYKPLESV